MGCEVVGVVRGVKMTLHAESQASEGRCGPLNVSEIWRRKKTILLQCKQSQVIIKMGR